MTPSLPELYDAIDGTWPAARKWQVGPFSCRDGQGGGKRVSAATANGKVGPDDIAQAEAAMREAGMPPLFMLREGEDALDAQLAGQSYEVADPTNLYAIPTTKLTDIAIPRVTAFAIWEPLAIMAEVWDAGGIGPERRAVMARAACKTGILARWNEKPAGAAFAAVHGSVCMVHAVEVLTHQRRQGVAGWLMRRAAYWGREQGADTLAVLCTEANTSANALYRALGFSRIGGYHYRTAKERT